MIVLRDYRPEDAAAIAELYTTSVHTVCVADYDATQREAWAPRPPDLARWQARLASKRPVVAEREGEVVGFAELEADGHIDCFYVHAGHQGAGIGSRLMAELERRARAAGLHRLYAEVSHTARPAFLRWGFRVIRENPVEVRGVRMSNWCMDRAL